MQKVAASKVDSYDYNYKDVEKCATEAQNNNYFRGYLAEQCK
ncbi:hypothetical protein [Pelosinus sp. UFO1]|nr:hypothetical protein [Pelosinus sp. UFO1]AIF52914.1 hypothetical protein UFO1_3371 [Pelosinus sp. UFO1]